MLLFDLKPMFMRFDEERRVATELRGLYLVVLNMTLKIWIFKSCSLTWMLAKKKELLLAATFPALTISSDWNESSV